MRTYSPGSGAACSVGETQQPSSPPPMKSVTNWKVDPSHVNRNGHDDGLRLSSVTVTVAGPEAVAAWGTSAWTVPEGHSTRITSAEARAPRPKRISAVAAAGTAAEDSNRWRRLPARTSIFV